MAAIARLEAKMSTTKPLGITGPLDILTALSVTIDTGPMLVQIANGVVAQAVRIFGTQGITTATAVLISSDQTVTVFYNGGNQALTLTANGFHLLASTSITAMTITNNSGSTANISIWLSGS